MLSVESGAQQTSKGGGVLVRVRVRDARKALGFSPSKGLPENASFGRHGPRVC